MNHMIFKIYRKLNRRYALNNDIFLAMNNSSFIFKLEEVDDDNDEKTPPKINLVLEKFICPNNSKEYDCFLSDNEKEGT